MIRTSHCTVLALALLVAPAALRAQLTILDSLSIDSIVTAMLVGPGCTVGNVSVQPDTTRQFGVFLGANTCLELDSGIILSTGRVSGALGPNDSPQSTTGVFPFTPSDPDIDSLFAPSEHFDEVILEFDVVPGGDSITLDLCFGSEEYYPSISSVFPDCFGIFISGPGLNGPFQNSAVNIAVIPGTGDSICTRSVNDLLGLNVDYYQHNGYGLIPPYDSDPYYLQYDGLTHLIHCSAPVQVGMSYHMKIVLADGTDWGLDAGLFLGAHSLTSPLSTGQANASMDQFSVRHQDQELSIIGLHQGHHRIEVLSSDGRSMMVREILTDQDLRFFIPELASGMYLLRVDGKAVRFLAQ